MSSNTINRQVQREQLATLLLSAHVGTGKPAQAVYSYKLGAFALGPVVLVYSGNIAREQQGLNQSQFTSTTRLVVEHWIPEADTEEAWGEADVENTLDLMSKLTADVVGDNRFAEDKWDYLDFEPGPSQIFEIATQGGLSWVVERFYITATKYD